MATFTPSVRTDKEFNAVYIRISAASKTDYIKTSMIVHKSGLKDGQITDYNILANCYIQIKKYADSLANINTEQWTANEIKKFLLQDKDNISFTDFSDKYIAAMKNDERYKSAENYKTALNSLKKHFGKENIFFSDITSHELRRWIKSLSGTKRAKSLYPVLMKKMFEDGCLEYNDYDRSIIRIQNQPFKATEIPNSDLPEKRFVESKIIRSIFAQTPVTELEQLAHDVSLMIIYLAGINTVDLYKVKKQELKDNKLCYNRSKTEKKRRDKAYFEITISEPIAHFFKKYAGNKNLLNFKERYSTPDCFRKAVNTGLKSLCEKAQVEKITYYCLRHTWATIAKNECGASTELVAFCLNHASAHKEAEIYIKKDFSPVDILNKKVIDRIFKTKKVAK
jgi:site-specific recombinase XerD